MVKRQHKILAAVGGLALCGAAAGDVLAAPRRAVTVIEGRTLVFVKTSGGFVKRQVDLGASADDMVEIKKGLTEGEEVASDGTFLLKSELLR